MVVQIRAGRLASGAVPPENQPPLLVHANGTEARQITAQFFNVVAGQRP